MVERKFGLGVVICIFNKDFSKILLLKRNEEKRKKYKADWGNVGGRVELGEKLIDACLREAREEIGINLNSKNLKFLEIDENPYLTEIFHSIHFIYATTLDEDERIEINYGSDEYNWFKLDNLPKSMIDKPEKIRRFAKLARKAKNNNSLR